MLFLVPMKNKAGRINKRTRKEKEQPKWKVLAQRAGLSERRLSPRYDTRLAVECLVDLLDRGSGASSAGAIGGAASTGHATGHTSWHPAGHTTRSAAGSLVQLRDDWHAHLLQFLLLVLELFFLGRLQ